MIKLGVHVNGRNHNLARRLRGYVVLGLGVLCVVTSWHCPRSTAVAAVQGLHTRVPNQASGKSAPPACSLIPIGPHTDSPLEQTQKISAMSDPVFVESQWDILVRVHLRSAPLAQPHERARDPRNEQTALRAQRLLVRAVEVAREVHSAQGAERAG